MIDHWVNQHCGLHRYLRYMGDLLFFGDRDTLRGVQRDAAGLLDGLGLRPKEGGVLNRCTLGVPWLGFVLYPDRARLNRLGRQRLRRKLKTIDRGWERGEIGARELQARAESLFAHARFADDVAWRRVVTGFSRIGEIA